MQRDLRRVCYPIATLVLLSLVLHPGGLRPTSVIYDAYIDQGVTSSPAFTGRFTENLGQVANEDVLFYGSLDGIQVGFGESSVLLKVTRISTSPGRLPSDVDAVRVHEPGRIHGALIRVDFVGANAVKPMAHSEQSHRSNYFVGNDPDRWQTNLPSFGEILYRELYDGIDLAYGWGENGLKYEFRVHPGADPGRITMAYEGVEGLGLDSAGRLIVRTALGDLTDTAPYSYQGGGIRVSCDFSLRGSLSYGFDCAGWDGSTVLVIDPLIYSTYLGGSFLDEGGALAVDSEGNAYVMGWTLSTDFPTTPGAFDEDYNGMWDVCVGKLSADGSTLIYSTYLGGSDSDMYGSVAVDSLGDAHLIGTTKSHDFPTTDGVLDTVLNGSYDVFAIKMSANGSELTYSTLLGGDSAEWGHSIAVDSDGNAYLAGGTMSPDFPTTPGAFDTSHSYEWDGFLSKLSANGSTLVYSTFLGGAGWDETVRSIAIDAEGSVFATGSTISSDFPTTPGAFDESWNGNDDAFVTKISANGSKLVYSTFLGGNESDMGFSIAVDSWGESYVTGRTRSGDFPVTQGAYDTTYDGHGSVFVTKLSANGTELIYSTYLGGFSGDSGFSIAIDTQGNAHVTGTTYSVDFPTTPGAFNRTFMGYSDVFVSKLDPSGGTLLYSTFLGGTSFDFGKSIVVESPSRVYVSGEASPDFPVTPGAYDTVMNGSDHFVTKLDLGAIDMSPVADAGPDRFVFEGDVVQFNGSGVSSQERLTINLTEPVRVHGVRTAVQQTSSMALNSQNHVLVAWADSRDGSPWALYFARSIDNGASFEPEIKLGEGIYWSYGSPRMAVDSSDTVYVVWVTLEDPDKLISGIQISRSIDGGKTFEDPRWVNESVGAFRTEPDIAIGGNDTVLVAWQELREKPVDDDPQVCVARSTDGESFSPCVEISGPTVGGWSIGSTSITRIVANQDEVYVGWRCDWYTEYQRYSAYVSGSSDGGVTFSEKVQVFVGIEDFAFLGLQSPALILSQDGILNLAWVGSLNETPDCPLVCDVSVFASDDGGQTFESAYSINDNSSGQPIRVVTMALDNEGSVYVAWSRVADSRIFVDRSTDGGRTFGEDVELLTDRPDESNFLGDIAFGSNGTFHLAWNSKDWPDSPDIYHSQGPIGLTSGNLTYEWDFDAVVDSDGNGNSTDDADATGPTPTWVYGDNGIFTVTLKVTDDVGNWDTDTMNVTVLNVAPEVSTDYTCAGGGPTDIMLRIAGEKWHDVTFAIFEDENEIYNETLVRMPGSPNEQMIGLEDFALNGSRSYAVVAYYTPEDDPVNGQIWGATPAWIILRSGGNETARLHHTFNVRHPQTWLWRVEDLGSYLPSRQCIFTAYASDPGSDDLAFSWDFGDGTTTEHVYYNDGIGPDPFPSPEINPAYAADEAKHSFASAGSYMVTLIVTDDDAGVSQVALVVVV